MTQISRTKSTNTLLRTPSKSRKSPCNNLRSARAVVLRTKKTPKKAKKPIERTATPAIKPRIRQSLLYVKPILPEMTEDRAKILLTSNRKNCPKELFDEFDWFTNCQTFRHEVNSTRWTDNKFHRANKLAASERAKVTEKKRQHELIKFDECSSKLHVFDQSVQYYCGVLYSQVSNCRSIEELRKTVPAVELSWIDQVVSQTSSNFLKFFKLDDSVGFLLQNFGRSENMNELVLVNTLNTRFINLVYTIYLLI